MDLSELDGFLAGLVAGPEIVPSDEWLAEVWDNEEPELRRRSRTGRRSNRPSSTAMPRSKPAWTPPRSGYAAILWQDEAGTTVAEDWAAGFMQAVTLRAKAVAAGAGR